MAATVKNATVKKATVKKAEKAAPVQVFTAEDIARARAEGFAAGKVAKKAERGERAARREVPGLHPLTLRDDDARYNVLGRCEYVVPGVCVVTGTVVMVQDDAGELVARFGIAPNMAFGVAGISAIGEESMLEIQSHTLKVSPEMLAHLRELYDAAADDHDYLAPADRKKADKAAREKAEKAAD